jgi:hypothetical protein
LTAFLALDPSAKTKIKEAIRGMGLPYNRKKIEEAARQLDQELKVLDTVTLIGIIDVVTDLLPCRLMFAQTSWRRYSKIQRVRTPASSQ